LLVKSELKNKTAKCYLSGNNLCIYSYLLEDLKKTVIVNYWLISPSFKLMA